ncbi:MAG: YoaK family protein [Pseudomonadota bacterium]
MPIASTSFMIRSQAFKNLLRKENVVLWMLLAFQAGFINAGGFVACHRFVSHVTGYGTHVGLSFAQEGFWLSLEMMVAPISFIAGAAFSAFLIDRPYYQQRKVLVTPALLIQSILLFLVFILGEWGLFGEFGEPLVLQRDFLLLFVLCFICGAQNATFACLTNGQIRTTHMTGISTDLGMNLVRIPFLNVAEKEKRYQKNLNWLRLFTFLSFMLGSGISAYVFSHLGYHGFIVPALTSLLVLTLSNRIMTKHERETTSIKVS